MTYKIYLNVQDINNDIAMTVREYNHITALCNLIPKLLLKLNKCESSINKGT